MTQKNFSYDEFNRVRPVSRETFDRLRVYVELIKKWQKSINLVSVTTVNAMWTRHIIDSSQLIDHIGANEIIADIGSGGGFPGLVMAILGIKNITLIESDLRKSVFLKEAVRLTDAPVTVLNKRIESIDTKYFSLITARAFAPLLTLLQMLSGTLTTKHKLLLLKGKNYRAEIEEARGAWDFDYTTFPSITDKEGVILSIHNLKPAEAL